MASTAASTPRSRGTEAGRSPATSRRPARATSTADGSRPTNEKRPQRPPCSTVSSRNPAPGPTSLLNAATGVSRSARRSLQTGTTVWSRASDRKSSLLGLSTERPVEAAVLAGVAGAPALLLHHDEHGVAVAVVVRLAHPLAVARRVALAPVLPAGAAPEPRAACGQRAAQRLLVHPRQREHPAGAVLLDDGGHQPVGVVGDLAEVVVGEGDGRCRGHASIVRVGLLRTRRLGAVRDRPRGSAPAARWRAGAPAPRGTRWPPRPGRGRARRGRATSATRSSAPARRSAARGRHPSPLRPGRR